MVCTVILVTILVGLISWIYFWSKDKYSHFADRNVPFRRPTFPIGNLGSLCASETSLTSWVKDFYFEYKDKHSFAGFFIGFEPAIVITDLNVAKCILTTNFAQFTDRAFYYNERDDPLSALLFSLEGERWRNMRTKLAPTFSNQNVRNMFESVHEISDNLLEYLDVNFVQKDEPFNVKYLSMRFICDSIGSCGFGLDCGALSDRDPILLKIAEDVFPYKRFRIMISLWASAYRDWATFFRLKLIPKHVTDYFRRLINETVKYREENNVVRNDFLNLLMQIKNQGCLVEDESGEELQKTSYEELQAHAFIIFYAGFHTSRTILTFALFELAANLKIQEELRQEIMEKLSPSGRMTYEALEEMTYLEQVVNETMRKYPPMASLSRTATTETRIPGTNYKLEKGQHIFIPTMAIHYDPDIYPDPDLFDPDRMTREKMKNRHPCSFLALGGGPRICLGYKFGLLQVKLAIVRILTKYHLNVDGRTKQPLNFLPHRLDFDVAGGVWLNAQPIT